MSQGFFYVLTAIFDHQRFIYIFLNKMSLDEKMKYDKCNSDTFIPNYYTNISKWKQNDRFVHALSHKITYECIIAYQKNQYIILNM